MATNDKDALFGMLREDLAVGVEEFLAAFRGAWPGETMYSFLFELPCEGTHVHAAAATEQGLIRIAQKYAKKGYRAKIGDSISTLQSWLRWAGPEDGWYQGAGHTQFRMACKLLDEAFAKEYIEMFDGQLNTLALATLADLDARGVFGLGPDREAVVLGMCYIGGDNRDEEFLEWANRVNPPKVMERLHCEIAASRALSEQIGSPWDM